MRSILMVTREDLIPTCKLIDVKDAELDSFKGQSTQKQEASIVVFYCSLTEKASIIKHRYGKKQVIDLANSEGVNSLLLNLLGAE